MVSVSLKASAEGSGSNSDQRFFSGLPMTAAAVTPHASISLASTSMPSVRW